MEIYHGSTVIVEKPEIRIEKFNKDFYFGFYCTVWNNKQSVGQHDSEKVLSMFMNIAQTIR